MRRSRKMERLGWELPFGRLYRVSLFALWRHSLYRRLRAKESYDRQSCVSKIETQTTLCSHERVRRAPGKDTSSNRRRPFLYSSGIAVTWLLRKDVPVFIHGLVTPLRTTSCLMMWLPSGRWTGWMLATAPPGCPRGAVCPPLLDSWPLVRLIVLTL